MIYKFKSKSCGDLIMLGADGDQLLRLLGREPAAQGIFDVADMPAVLASLEAAVASEAANLKAAAETEDPAGERAEPVVLLHQRLLPMMDMLRASHAAGHPVVWGV